MVYLETGGSFSIQMDQLYPRSEVYEFSPAETGAGEDNEETEP